MEDVPIHGGLERSRQSEIPTVPVTIPESGGYTERRILAQSVTAQAQFDANTEPPPPNAEGGVARLAGSV